MRRGDQLRIESIDQNIFLGGSRPDRRVQEILPGRYAESVGYDQAARKVLARVHTMCPIP